MDRDPAARPESVPPPADSPGPNRLEGDDPLAAGESARQEHTRRRTTRTAANRARYGAALGPVVTQLTTPQHETAWAKGAQGEVAVAARLAEACDSTVTLFHDRRFAGSKANIDHLAVTPAGVWVIDTKWYRGKVRVERRLLHTPKLRIAGRDQTNLLGEVQKQAVRVTEILERDVTAALCFVEADLPLSGLGSIHGVELVSPRRLAARLNRSGPLCEAERHLIAEQIDARFPRRAS